MVDTEAEESDGEGLIEIDDTKAVESPEKD